MEYSITVIIVSIQVNSKESIIRLKLSREKHTDSGMCDTFP